MAIVSEDWVFESVRAGRRLPYELFRLPPLLGFVIVTSGISLSEGS